MTFLIASYTAPLPAPSEKQLTSVMLMLDLDSDCHHMDVDPSF